MNEAKHTAEPWKTGGSLHGKSVIFLVGDEPAHTLGHEENWIDCNTEANARRIVACVNACAGLDTDYLENVGLPEFVGKTLCADLAQQELDAVTAQRDQLQARVNELESQELSWRKAMLSERKKVDNLLSWMEHIQRAALDVSVEHTAIHDAAVKAMSEADGDAAITAVEGGQS